MLRYLGSLVDPCFDLERPVDEPLLGKLVDNQLAVVGRIATRSEPRDHIVAAARHHWEHEKELGLRLTGQPHDDVVRGHRCNAVAARLPRELPEVLAVIENLGGLHVVGLIEPRLNQKEVLRIANVLLKVRRHRRERLEQARKDALVGQGNRVAGVHQIEVDGSVIGIDDDLHRIANIVEIEVLRWLRRGEVGTRRVGVLHPEHPPIADDQIRIVVEPEERSDRSYSFPDIAPDHDPAVGGDVT